MKTVAVYHKNIPAYALPYLVNSDPSGLDLHDITAIDAFMAEFEEQAEQAHGSVIFAPDPDAEPHFTWSPAFGLACEVEPCTILIVN